MHNYIHNISSDKNVSVSTDHHTVPKLFYDSWIEWTFQPVYPPKLPSHKVRPPACIPLWEISTDVCNLQIITPTAFFLPALLFLQSLFFSSVFSLLFLAYPQEIQSSNGSFKCCLSFTLSIWRSAGAKAGPWDVYQSGKGSGVYHELIHTESWPCADVLIAAEENSTNAKCVSVEVE